MIIISNKILLLRTASSQVCLDHHSVYWDAATGNNDAVTGAGHTNQVTDMVVDGDNLISVGVDDFVRFTSVSAKQFRSVLSVVVKSLRIVWLCY